MSYSDAKRNVRLLAFAMLIGCCLALGKTAIAAEPHQRLITSHDTSPMINPVFFKGIDTLAVGDGFEPGETARLLNLNSKDNRATITSEVQKIFSDASAHLPVSWVSIKPAFPMHTEDFRQPNVMMANFILSAREQMIAGRPVKIAALSLHLVKRGSDQNYTEGAMYPFIVPDTQDELNERIRDGVFYLSSTLPNYFACANKYGYQTKECPDCSLSSCGFHETWEERRK